MRFICCRLGVAMGAGILASLGVGCGSGQGEGRSPEPVSATNVVARVDDRIITLDALERELASRPGNRASTQLRERVLQELIDREAMLLRAQHAGFDQEPPVRAQLERVLASLWQEKELARRFSDPVPISDAEVTAFYEANEARFRKPGAVRAGVIFLAAHAQAPSEQRAEDRARAQIVRELAVEADDPAFRQLVQKHSDDQSTRYIGGDTGWIEDGMPAGRLPPAVLEAIHQLRLPGEVGDLVETPEGFHVIRLLDRREPTRVPLEEVADAVRYSLHRQRELESQQAFLDEIKQGLEIEINHPLLEIMAAPISAESQTPPALPGG